MHKHEHKHKHKHEHTNTRTHEHTNTRKHEHTNTRTHEHTNTRTHENRKNKQNQATCAICPGHRQEFRSESWLSRCHRTHVVSRMLGVEESKLTEHLRDS